MTDAARRRRRRQTQQNRYGDSALRDKKHHRRPTSGRFATVATRQLPDLQTHAGYEWLYVLDGLLRLVLGEHDHV
jgi:hypothetical protein